MTAIQIPGHPGVDIRLWRDDSPTPAVIVTTDEWGQELHLPVSVAREVAAAILAALDWPSRARRPRHHNG